MDHFLRAVPPEERKAVRMENITGPREMVEALKCALATLSLGRGEQKDFSLSQNWKRRLPERHPTYGTPRDESMPTELDPATLKQVVKLWLADCALHSMSAPDTPTTAVNMAGRPVSALLHPSTPHRHRPSA